VPPPVGDALLVLAVLAWLRLGGWDAPRDAREGRRRGWLLVAFYGGLAGWVGWNLGR
jgi:hypothetical protein